MKVCKDVKPVWRGQSCRELTTLSVLIAKILLSPDDGRETGDPLIEGDPGNMHLLGSSSVSRQVAPTSWSPLAPILCFSGKARGDPKQTHTVAERANNVTLSVNCNGETIVQRKQ